MKGWVDLVGWPPADDLSTYCGHPSAEGRACDRESSPAKTDVLATVPRHQPDTLVSVQICKYYPVFKITYTGTSNTIHSLLIKMNRESMLTLAKDEKVRWNCSGCFLITCVILYQYEHSFTGEFHRNSVRIHNFFIALLTYYYVVYFVKFGCSKLPPNCHRCSQTKFVLTLNVTKFNNSNPAYLSGFYGNPDSKFWKP